jgi:hypothetical protein
LGELRASLELWSGLADQNPQNERILGLREELPGQGQFVKNFDNRTTFGGVGGILFFKNRKGGFERIAIHAGCNGALGA